MLPSTEHLTRGRGLVQLIRRYIGWLKYPSFSTLYQFRLGKLSLGSVSLCLRKSSHTFPHRWQFLIFRQTHTQSPFNCLWGEVAIFHSSVPMAPHASQSTLVPNLLLLHKQINSGWIRVCFKAHSPKFATGLTHFTAPWYSLRDHTLLRLPPVSCFSLMCTSYAAFLSRNHLC